MDLSNWISIAVAAGIFIVGIAVFGWCRRKFKRINGFKGIISERGKRRHSADYDWNKKDSNEREKDKAKR